MYGVIKGTDRAFCKRDILKTSFCFWACVCSFSQFSVAGSPPARSSACERSQSPDHPAHWSQKLAAELNRIKLFEDDSRVITIQAVELGPLSEKLYQVLVGGRNTFEHETGTFSIRPNMNETSLIIRSPLLPFPAVLPVEDRRPLEARIREVLENRVHFQFMTNGEPFGYGDISFLLPERICVFNHLYLPQAFRVLEAEKLILKRLFTLLPEDSSLSIVVQDPQTSRTLGPESNKILRSRALQTYRKQNGEASALLHASQLLAEKALELTAAPESPPPEATRWIEALKSSGWQLVQISIDPYDPRRFIFRSKPIPGGPINP